MALNYRSPLILQLTPGAAGAGNTDHTITRPFRITDCLVVGTAVQAGGTATLQRQAGGAGAFTALTDAVACAAVDTATRAATLVQAQCAFVANDVLRIVLAGVATNGNIFGTAWAAEITGNG